MGPCKRLYIKALQGLTLGLALMLIAPVSSALSVRQFGIEQILSGSPMVVEGRVTHIDVTRMPDRPSFLMTHVTMELLDVIKGGNLPKTITFSMLGGTLGDYTFGVAGYRTPALGESGIYFMTESGANHAQPFYGWSQGRFQIQKDASGAEYVTTYAGKPVYGLVAGGDKQAKALSHGVARGVRTKALNSSELPMSALAFKQALRGMLATQEVQ